jgi:single-stranded-DNA-specific exonuclease
MNNKEILTREYDINEHNLHSLHPVVQQVLLGRGIKDLSEITHDKHKLLSFHSLLGVEQAANLLYSSIIKNKSILIIGDYDADGATSTSLCMRFFKDLSYLNISYLIPNRVKDGYGLTPEIVETAKSYDPDLIITVDNGITSIEGVNAAKQLNWKVLITDHHLPGSELPNADVIVNPNQQNCEFPSKNLAGVGVIFYVLCCLRAKLVQQDYFKKNAINSLNMSNYLDLVALGTVADVVPLDHNNRTLVQLGLDNIRKGKCSYGILALCEIANRKPSNLISSDFGFVIAPRLNAAGRLDDMSIGIKCLIADNVDEAMSYASTLNSLNERRKTIEREMQQDAFDILSDMHIDLDVIPFGICLYNSKWHEGVIGILASRLKDKYNRPTVIFTATPQCNVLKGSARSIHGINIKNVFEKIALEHPNIILKFGGHAMAAGLSINAKEFDRFTNIFIEEIERNVSEESLRNTILTDGIIDENDIDLNLAKMLYFDIPWGQSFPEPCFRGEFFVIDCSILGNKHLKLTLAVSNRRLKAIAFNVPQQLQVDYINQKLAIAYRISINSYYDQEEVQFVIEQLQIV